MMAGIERIRILSDWQDWRTRMAEELSPTADSIYRRTFLGLNLPLDHGIETIECTKEEARSRYDWQEGIDVLLHFQQGGKATLQEKFLTYERSTVTFEERKSSGAPGAWYYCTAQYYFVGYARQYRGEERLLEFQDWILIDLAALRRADGQGQLPWEFNENRHDGRRAQFRYVYFAQVPQSCLVASMQRILARSPIPPSRPVMARQLALF